MAKSLEVKGGSVYMPSVPKGSISLPDLVEMVVVKHHGQDAVAELEKHEKGEKEGKLKITHGKVTSFKDNGETIKQREEYIYRAGKKISLAEDGERWAGAKGKINDALSSDKLKAHIITKSDVEWAIGGDYWRGEDAWMVFETGNLENPDLEELADRPVYLYRAEAMDWLATIPGTGASPPAEDEQDKSAPKKKRQPGTPKSQTVAGRKEAHDEIKRFQKLLVCNLTDAAEEAALDSDRDADALLRARRHYLTDLKAAKRQE